jgi:hypothetical protein
MAGLLMNVKHNAQFRVRCSAGLSGFPSDDIIEARLLDAHLTALSVLTSSTVEA